MIRIMNLFFPRNLWFWSTLTQHLRQSEKINVPGAEPQETVCPHSLDKVRGGGGAAVHEQPQPHSLGRNASNGVLRQLLP